MTAIRCLGLNSFLQVFSFYARTSPELSHLLDPWEIRADHADTIQTDSIAMPSCLSFEGGTTSPLFRRR